MPSRLPSILASVRSRLFHAHLMFAPNSSSSLKNAMPCWRIPSVIFFNWKGSFHFSINGTMAPEFRLGVALLNFFENFLCLMTFQKLIFFYFLTVAMFSSTFPIKFDLGNMDHMDWCDRISPILSTRVGGETLDHGRGNVRESRGVFLDLTSSFGVFPVLHSSPFLLSSSLSS